MVIHQYNREARRRIRNAVKRVESMPLASGNDRTEARHREQLPTLVKAYGDVPRNQVGTFKLVGQSWAAPVEVTGITLSAINLGQRIWDGSICLIQRAALAEATRTSDKTTDTIWVVQRAWSATRIRGVTSAAISPGQTGNIGSLVTIDGTFLPTTAAVYLPTDHIVVDSGMKLWAELVGDRWEAYAADCSGE